jgi:hypothetical protein
MKRILILGLILFTACTVIATETGSLAGNVTIGPLQPAVQEGVPEPTPGPQVYAARKILVLSQDSQREIARVSINPDGTYAVTLPVGFYVIDILGSAIERGMDLPREIEILSGQTTYLDIDIDTGIR